MPLDRPATYTTAGSSRRNTAPRPPRLAASCNVALAWADNTRHRPARHRSRLHHCVASYADRCAVGQCSIWSLKALVGDLVMERRTVEVNRDRVIVQVRGKCNAPAGGEALDVVRRWAKKENLTLAAWI